MMLLSTPNAIELFKELIKSEEVKIKHFSMDKELKNC